MSKKYKIGINTSFTPSGGSLTQITNMIHYLSDEKNLELVIYSKKKNTSIFKNINLKNHKITLSWLSNTSVMGRVIWEQLFLPFHVARDRIDVLFCPGNISPIFSSIKKVQWIGTIGPFWEDMYKLDIGWWNRTRYPILKYFMYKTAQKSDEVIFESEYTKQLFNNKYGVNPRKSHVINIGKDKFFFSISDYENSENYSIHSPFLLCVSHLYPYKNIPRMIEAFAIAKRTTKSDYKLLIAGEKKTNKYLNEIIITIKKQKIKDSVILLGGVSKEDLRYLFSSCKFLISPSPCENFAYTLVEAMNCGVAITCSNTTAMPETCQEAALYFDPNNTEEISEKIKLLIIDKEFRKTLGCKSLERVKQLPDYEEVTNKTLDIIKNLVNSDESRSVNN